MISLSWGLRLARALGWGRQGEWIQRHGRGLAFFSSLGYAVSLVSLHVLPQQKTVNVVIEPRDQSNVAGLSGSVAAIAARFGVQPNPQGTSSLDLFAGLLESDTLLRQVVSQRFVGTAQASNPLAGAPLAELWQRPWSSDADLVASAAKKLRKVLNVAPDISAGTIVVSLTTDDPEMFRTVALALVQGANRRLEAVNQQSHRYERDFLDRQLAIASEGLYQAEDSLRRFYDDNRSIASSPHLKLEESRRLRRVDLAQQIYTELALRVAAARQEEARDTPQLLVVDAGTIPPNRGPIANVVLSLAAALGFASFWAAWRLASDYLRTLA